MKHLAVYDDSTKEVKFLTNDLPPNVRPQQAAIGSGATSVTITYGTALDTGRTYVVVASLQTPDSSPQFQAVDITASTNTGFTASWNAPTDSANYLLNYIAIGV
jgi:hypothetical protein